MFPLTQSPEALIRLAYLTFTQTLDTIHLFFFSLSRGRGFEFGFLLRLVGLVLIDSLALSERT